MAAFTPPAEARAPAGQLAGRLTLDTSAPLALAILRDDYALAADPALMLARLPAFSFDYVQAGDEMIPLLGGLQRGDHPHWDIILAPGRIWRIAGSAATRISLPFALQEKNANCTHNGVLRATLGEDGSTSKAEVLMASETCLYLQFNLAGEVPARFEARPPGDAEPAVAAHRRWRARQLPVRPLATLARQRPDLDLTALAGADGTPKNYLSARGLVIGDTHYASRCPTRRGDYPFCDVLGLPSYSLAKSLVGALGLMRLEHLYPGSARRPLAELVPACGENGSWGDVTLEHVLNMVSGHYGSAAPHADESDAATLAGFFDPGTHAAKIDFACNAWPRRENPGATFVYHTPDTYLLGTAMSAILREHRDSAADLYRDLLGTLWRPLELSPDVSTTRRTMDARQQPFTGYGLTLRRDDIARLARALNRGDFDDRLDNDMLRAALRRPGAGAGFPAGDGLDYRHGFWGYDATGLLGCEAPLIVPFMSGFGGISVLLLPGDMIYYQFGDGGRFSFAVALQQVHSLHPLCETASGNTIKETHS